MSQGLEMKYFVLKPRGNDEYARASRAAMRRYAKVIAASNPKLANELTLWADNEFADQFADDGIEEDFSEAARGAGKG